MAGLDSNVDGVSLNDKPGNRLIGGAWAFFRAAELLYGSEMGRRAWATCFVQINFALELGLKAFLRAKGGSEQDQLKLRHNLVFAYQAAINRGFVPTQPAICERYVGVLSKHHEDMSLRYHTGTVVTLFVMEDALHTTKIILSDLTEQIAANGSE